MSSKGILIAVVAFALGAGAAGLTVLYVAAPAPADRPALYRCPMHPTMTSDRPGDCPICGMRLVPQRDEREEHQSALPAQPDGKKVIYRSTMNPSEVSDQPGLDSMGMEMVPVEVEERPPAAASGVPGRAAVKVSAQKRQLIGVRTAPVERRMLARTIRTVGRVATDETRLHHVHTKVGGWIETLHVNATGEKVLRGQPLLTIYSPELLASAEEYLLALRARDRLARSASASLAGSGEELVASARRRLRLFDLTEGQIAELERTGRAPRTMTLYAPMTGHVIARNVTHGEKIEPGTNLLGIADLSRVWVLADVYEYELPFVREGQPAVMTLSYFPGRRFEGRITLIYPVVSEATRTVKVRLEFPNPELALKPEMYADVEVRAELGERLVAPGEAVIATGERDVAFVEVGEGLFEPRELSLGARLTDGFEVLAGLAEGERVVVSANFLIDSESRLKAALAATGEAPAAESPPPPPPGHRH